MKDNRPYYVKGSPCYIIRDGRKLGAYLNRNVHPPGPGHTIETWDEDKIPVFLEGGVGTVSIG